MRWIAFGVVGVVLGLGGLMARAEEKTRTTERVISGVISGLLGQPQPSQDEAYTAQEREQLATLLQRGKCATSHQGQPVDLMIVEVPLTRAEHVYSAKLIPPSQSVSHSGSR